MKTAALVVDFQLVLSVKKNGWEILTHKLTFPPIAGRAFFGN